MKKFSILGVVLLGASAVTAAFVPSKKDKNSLAACNGVAAATAQGFTCRAAGSQQTCFTVIDEPQTDSATGANTAAAATSAGTGNC